MKRLFLLLAIASLAAGCFGACGGETTSSSSAASTETSTTSTTTAGSDTTEPEGSGPHIVVGTDPCTTDADCVPAGCCHPSACVAQANAPSCIDSVCTSDCRYGTLDCGGGCLCQEGHCAARLSELPHIPGVSPEVN